jgi:hypothetical protein
MMPKISLNEHIVNKTEEQAIICTREQFRKHLVYRLNTYIMYQMITLSNFIS